MLNTIYCRWSDGKHETGKSQRCILLTNTYDHMRPTIEWILFISNVTLHITKHFVKQLTTDSFMPDWTQKGINEPMLNGNKLLFVGLLRFPRSKNRKCQKHTKIHSHSHILIFDWKETFSRTKRDERKYYFNIKYEKSLIRVAPTIIQNMKCAKANHICKAATATATLFQSQFSQNPLSLMPHNTHYSYKRMLRRATSSQTFMATFQFRGN